MKKFVQLNVGDEFHSECKISLQELESYLSFAGIKNVIYDTAIANQKKMVSGRAMLSRMEGEFTKLDEIKGNFLVFYGMDGDSSWNNRQTRFLRPLFTDEQLKIKFKIVQKRDLDNEFGLIEVDFEGMDKDEKIIVISRRNLYRIKKDVPEHQ